MRAFIFPGMGGMFFKMLDWKIGLSHDFRVSTGSHGKYLKKYLPEEEMARVREAFPDGRRRICGMVWASCTTILKSLAEAVAGGLGYPYDQKEAERGKGILQNRRKNETQKGG